jgi:hypothetical protein
MGNPRRLYANALFHLEVGLAPFDRWPSLACGTREHTMSEL